MAKKNKVITRKTLRAVKKALDERYERLKAEDPMGSRPARAHITMAINEIDQYTEENYG